ncbi:MAG: hypothetical protein Harvfovirus19_6 [Harvfovirus sp.]|uniref:Uncharacterized protein n=1 Tax=Harvfovirus sp. TaxID=2487768 RepID=A0A3G5A4L9_9VIRU|nr:MAG: hypothetical protein Harvfovirus19_6 [Harvfovirus sp.]
MSDLPFAVVAVSDAAPSEQTQTVYWERLKMSHVFSSGKEGKNSGVYTVPKSAIAATYFAGGMSVNDCNRGEVSWSDYTTLIPMCDWLAGLFQRQGKEIGRHKLTTLDIPAFEGYTKSHTSAHSQLLANLAGAIVQASFYRDSRLWNDPAYFGKK